MSDANDTPTADYERFEAGTAVADEPDGPPLEQDFWKAYNEHYEFPIGTAMSVLAHVLIIAILVFGFLNWMKGKDKSPVKMMSLGDDDTGMGMEGGGDINPLLGALPPPDQLEVPPDLEKIKDLEDKLKLDDPLNNIPIPDAFKHAYSQLDKELQDKLLGAQKRGEDKSGVGPGGTGSDTTRARGLRWVMRFNTKSGQDYLNQLRALKAVVMIPVPPDNKRMLILRDLSRPRTDEYATDSDIAQQAGKIQFQDVRKESCEAIAEALRLGKTPTAFWAFFPKELEEQMSQLETSYQNKKSEQIKETVFQVIVTGGEARLRVVAQKLK